MFYVINHGVKLLYFVIKPKVKLLLFVINPKVMFKMSFLVIELVEAIFD